MKETVLLWFKRDLRVADHPALGRAAALGPVLPVYIVEPGYWAQPDVSGRQFAFLRETLATVERDLARIGLPLVIRVGAAVPVLETLRRESGARWLVSHEETGNLWTFARDRAVAEWARGQGVLWEELAQCGVVRRLNGRDRWAARRGGVMAAAQVGVPSVEAAPALARDPWPDFGLVDPCPERQRGGRAEAEAALRSFLGGRGRTYRKAMSSPLEGATACSRLSPHLALGALSIREVVQATAARQKEIPQGARDGWAGALKSFQARLAWRDHFMQKLEDAPDIERRAMHPAMEGVWPEVPDLERFERWQAGETGVPFVDACMRSLRATGWLNFRMRAMVMSFASYQLWLDWRGTGAHLARMFTDYEPGIHWPQVQMQSGTTGMNTIRIYNPVKQGRDQDPAGLFTRRWVPELEAVPEAFLQVPWLWPGAQALGYPEPVVDHEAAARHARERLWAMRRAPGFRDAAAAVVKRHASRKPPRPRKAPRRADPRQRDFGF